MYNHSERTDAAVYLFTIAKQASHFGSGLEIVNLAIDVSTEIVIDRPLKEIAAFATDPDNAPKWYENIKSVEWKSQKSVKVGAKIDFVAEFLGRRLTCTYEIVEFAANKRMVMRTAEGPFPMETTYIWEETDDGRSRMTLPNRGEPAGFSKITAPLMGQAMRRANHKT